MSRRLAQLDTSAPPIATGKKHAPPPNARRSRIPLNVIFTQSSPTPEKTTTRSPGNSTLLCLHNAGPVLLAETDEPADDSVSQNTIKTPPVTIAPPQRQFSTRH